MLFAASLESKLRVRVRHSDPALTGSLLHRGKDVVLDLVSWNRPLTTPALGKLTRLPLGNCARNDLKLLI